MPHREVRRIPAAGLCDLCGRNVDMISPGMYVFHLEAGLVCCWDSHDTVTMTSWRLSVELRKRVLTLIADTIRVHDGLVRRWVASRRLSPLFAWRFVVWLRQRMLHALTQTITRTLSLRPEIQSRLGRPGEWTVLLYRGHHEVEVLGVAKGSVDSAWHVAAKLCGQVDLAGSRPAAAGELAACG